MDKHYAERDIIGQGDHYTRHVVAMTREGLHDKSDIAAELAHRDQQIEQLQAQVKADLEFMQHVKKCLVKNREYAPLIHQYIDETMASAEKVLQK